MIDNLRQINRSISASTDVASSRAASMVAMGGNAQSAMAGGGTPANTSNGQVVANPGGLNNGLDVNDPDYDPILELLPGAYSRYMLAGDVVGVYSVKP